MPSQCLVKYCFTTDLNAFALANAGSGATATSKAASSFFKDNVLDLGAVSGFVSSSNHVLQQVFNLELTTQVQKAGLDFGLVVGNGVVVGAASKPLSLALNAEPLAAVPLPGSFWMLASALSGFGMFNRRRNSVQLKKS